MSSSVRGLTVTVLLAFYTAGCLAAKEIGEWQQCGERRPNRHTLLQLATVSSVLLCMYLKLCRQLQARCNCTDAQLKLAPYHPEPAQPSTSEHYSCLHMCVYAGGKGGDCAAYACVDDMFPGYSCKAGWTCQKEVSLFAELGELHKPGMFITDI